MTARKDPLFADVDPNRAFIRQAVTYLQSRSDYGDDAAYQILREFFIQSGMLDAEWLTDELEKQLTFRDGLVGDKLEAMTAIREAHRFMARDVYEVFTDQGHPKSQLLCDILQKAENALDVFSAGYIDTEGLRYIQDAVEREDPDAEFEVIPISSEPLYQRDGNIIKLRTLSK